MNRDICKGEENFHAFHFRFNLLKRFNSLYHGNTVGMGKLVGIALLFKNEGIWHGMEKSQTTTGSSYPLL